MESSEGNRETTSANSDIEIAGSILPMKSTERKFQEGTESRSTDTDTDTDTDTAEEGIYYVLSREDSDQEEIIDLLQESTDSEDALSLEDVDGEEGRYELS